jgi:hypothetical protein
MKWDAIGNMTEEAMKHIKHKNIKWAKRKKAA